MAFIVKADLQSNLYPEIIDEIIRKFQLHYANEAAFPETGIAGYIYVDDSNENIFIWSTSSYIPATDPDAIVTRAINSGIAEVKSYLSRYDVVTLFDGSTLDENITEHLKSICIDVICWRLITLGNPNIDLKLSRTKYEDAIKWLKLVQEGKADPVGWPYKTDDTATKDFNENQTVQWSSNHKRRQSF